MGSNLLADFVERRCRLLRLFARAAHLSSHLLAARADVNPYLRLMLATYMPAESCHFVVDIDLQWKVCHKGLASAAYAD